MVLLVLLNHNKSDVANCCFHCFVVCGRVLCFCCIVLFLLLSKLAVTHLDNILKSRDVTLATKVSLVKAVVFPVVMYGCESWTVKKAEL